MRLFAIAEGIRRGFAIDEIYERTWIDKFFLKKLSRLVATETAICAMKTIDDALLTQAVRMAFTDSWIAKLSGIRAERIRQRRKELGLVHTYKMVDTCAGEYDAVTPYFYSTFDMKNEAIRTERKKSSCSDPARSGLGQGIEFDYCSVHSVWALRELGYEAIIANNNPETVSTDFDTSDRLYFEPLTPDDVRAIIENEKPDGAICQFGGQTAIKLIKAVSEMGLPIYGTSADGVDAAEDRQRFDAIPRGMRHQAPSGTTVRTADEAIHAAADLGYRSWSVRPMYLVARAWPLFAINTKASMPV